MIFKVLKAFIIQSFIKFLTSKKKKKLNYTEQQEVVGWGFNDVFLNF